MDYIIQKTERKVKLKKRQSPKPLSIKSIHNERCKYFEDLQKKILPEKIKKLQLLKKSEKNNYYEISVLQKEIQRIESREEEYDYYYNTSEILDKYFLLDSGETNEKDTDYTKTDLVRRYYDILNLDIPKEYFHDLRVDHVTCKTCNENNSFVDCDESGTVCKNCGVVEKGAFISDVLSYKDRQTTEYTVVLDYKRVDYFKQWLNQIQAKEQTDIPIDVIDTIVLQIKTERIKNISNISIPTMKKLLKKTNNSKYYEHIPFIINHINKVPQLNIPPYIEDKLIAMFETIQRPWEEVKTKERKNFFSYPYTLHKFCQILGLTEYLPYFPLLKSREKLYKQDVIWKKIIEYMQNHPSNHISIKDVKWVFIASV